MPIEVRSLAPTLPQKLKDLGAIFLEKDGSQVLENDFSWVVSLATGSKIKTFIGV